MDIVHHWGFLLLEEVEAKLDTAHQSVLKVVSTTLMEPLLSALASRVFRQAENVNELGPTELGQIACMCLARTRRVQSCTLP